MNNGTVSACNGDLLMTPLAIQHQAWAGGSCLIFFFNSVDAVHVDYLYNPRQESSWKVKHVNYNIYFAFSH